MFNDVSDAASSNYLAGKWLDTNDAIKVLGRGYSRPSLWRKMRDGDLVEGVHFVRLGTRTLKFNVERIREDWEDAW